MELDPFLLASVFGVVFMASLVRATWGFGDAVVGIPLLGALVGLQVAAPMLVPITILLSLLLLRERGREVELDVVGRLLAGALIGIPIGVHLLVEVPEAWASAALGSVLLGFSLWSLWRVRRRPAEPDPSQSEAAAIIIDLGFGVLVGACSAAFDISGPVLLVHASARRWTPERVRMNLQAVFLPLGCLTLGGHAIAGLWNPTLAIATLACIPAVFLALWIGARLRTRLAGARGVMVLHLLIGGLGLWMLLG